MSNFNKKELRIIFKKLGKLLESNDVKVSFASMGRYGSVSNNFLSEIDSIKVFFDEEIHLNGVFTKLDINYINNIFSNTTDIIDNDTNVIIEHINNRSNIVFYMEYNDYLTELQFHINFN